MTLEGLGFSNSIFRVATPMEVNIQAEQISKEKAETVIKKIEEGEKIKADVENEDEETNYEGRDFEDREETESDDALSKQKEKIKKYKVKFNSITNMVELINQTTGYVVETIMPNDLINLISKTAGANGILVDKEA